MKTDYVPLPKENRSVAYPFLSPIIRVLLVTLFYFVRSWKIILNNSVSNFQKKLNKAMR